MKLFKGDKVRLTQGFKDVMVANGIGKFIESIKDLVGTVCDPVDYNDPDGKQYQANIGPEVYVNWGVDVKEYPNGYSCHPKYLELVERGTMNQPVISPHANQEVHEKIMAKLQGMSSKEILETAISAGIYELVGGEVRLTEHYRSDPTDEVVEKKLSLELTNEQAIELSDAIGVYRAELLDVAQTTSKWIMELRDTLYKFGYKIK